jgi:hypothetical protein
MPRSLLIFLSAALITGSVFILSHSNKLSFNPALVEQAVNIPNLSVPEAATGSTAAVVNAKIPDLPPQQPLANPPAAVKAIYLTGWSAGSSSKIQWVIDLAKSTELNAVVIDIKDYSGYVSYAMDMPETKSSGADRQIRIAHPNALIKQLHDNNIYVIARVTVFQDPILAAARPDLAVKNKNTGEVWKDQKGLAWLDPAGKETWDYVVAIANDAISRGFDEVNFDYIRFPSDGALANVEFPFYKPTVEKHEVLREFFNYLREHVKGKISADVFGLTTVAEDDMGIGQLIEDAAQYFDYVSPMVYPSHYAAGFIGYKNPALHPYEVISYSLNNAIDKFFKIPAAADGSASRVAKLRPWLQDFDMGATYTASMVKDEMKAVTDSFCLTEPTETEAAALAKLTGPGRKCGSMGEAEARKQMYNGWVLWDSNNTYTTNALAPK